MDMCDFGFQFDGSKAYLVKGKVKKELSKETMLEMYQIILGQLVPNRDYSSVTSIKKLQKVIDLECEPDESDDEQPTEVQKEVPKPKAVTVVPVAAQPPKTESKVVKKKAPPPAPKEEQDEDDDE